MVATETVGPFDGTPWAQDQWYRYAAAFAPSGVLDVPQTSPAAGGLGLTFNGLTPTLAAGRAWVRGGGYELSGGSKTLTSVPANTNSSLSRRDRLVLRRDLAAKTIVPTFLQGTPAATPAAPALQQVETGQWDEPLFSWTTPPNSGTAITAITDERGWVQPTIGDTGWVTATAQNGWGAGVNYRVLNGVCHVDCWSQYGSGGSYPGGSLLAVLPVTPKFLKHVTGYWAGVAKEVDIDTAGGITVQAAGSGGVLFSTSFPVG